MCVELCVCVWEEEGEGEGEETPTSVVVLLEFQAEKKLQTTPSKFKVLFPAEKLDFKRGPQNFEIQFSCRKLNFELQSSNLKFLGKTFNRPLTFRPLRC